MNFYFDAARIMDRLDAKQGSVKSLLSTISEKSRKRTAALVIETLKCEGLHSTERSRSTDELPIIRQARACGSNRSCESPEGGKKDNVSQSRFSLGA